MPFEYFSVLIVSVLAGAVASISGFGIGSLLTPLFALSMDLQLAVAAVSIPHLLATGLRFFLIHKHLNREIFIRFGIWSAAGGLAGSLLGLILKDRILIVIFSLLLIFAGTTGAFGFAEKMRIPRPLAWLAGLSSGMFGGLVGNQGGIRSAALIGFALKKAEFVATATGIALLVDAARMPVYFAGRHSDLVGIWPAITWAVLGVLIGTLAGQPILEKIPERIFKRTVSGIILALGVSMLFKAFSPGSTASTPAVSTASASPSAAATATVLHDLVYVPGSGSNAHKLDLYLPQNSKSKKWPLVIWIHGGAWLGGDKNPAPYEEFIKNGYAFASVNYRLIDEATFPAQIHDLKAAVRFMRASANKYGIDPRKFAAFGMSSGGQLASLLGTSNGVPALEGSLGVTDQSSDVQAACDWCGLADFMLIKKASYSAPDSVFRRLLGGTPETKKELAAMASPVTFVSKDDPPFLIMHGDRDRVVPIAQSRKLNESLVRKGVPTTFKVVEGADHYFENSQTLKAVVEFLDTHLKGK